MKKFLQLTSLLIISSMLLTACGSDDKPSRDRDRDRDDTEIEETEEVEETEEAEETERTTVTRTDSGDYIYDHDFYTGEVGIEPAPSYLNNYYEEMDVNVRLLAGEYSLDDTPEQQYSEADYYDNAIWVDPVEFLGTDTYTDDYGDNDLSVLSYISVLPTSIRSGASFDIGLIDDYDFCMVYYAVSYDDEIDPESYLNTRFFYAVQEVHDNQLTIRFLSEYTVGDNGVVTYQFTGNEITYDIYLSYNQMHLSYEGSEVCLSSYNYNVNDYLYIGDEISVNSDPIDNITSLYLGTEDDDRDSDYFRVYCDENGEEVRYDGIARLTDDGIFSFAYTDSAGVSHVHHFVLILLGSDGFALINEDGVSVFAAWYENYIDERNQEAGYVGFNVLPGDDDTLSGLSRDQIDTLNEATNRFFDDLEDAFNSEGLSVAIDKDSGAIVLDASVLFDNNQFDINSDGEALLDSFMESVLSVLSNEEYDMLLSQIVIQGHTDSNGTYEHNVDLSENRANAVMDYLVSALIDNTSYEATYLSSILTAEGCASDFLIYNDDGSENAAASRRVEFVFYVNLDYVNQ